MGSPTRYTIDRQARDKTFFPRLLSLIEHICFLFDNYATSVLNYFSCVQCHSNKLFNSHLAYLHECCICLKEFIGGHLVSKRKRRIIVSKCYLPILNNLCADSLIKEEMSQDQ